MSTSNSQLPTPKGLRVDRLRLLWELGVGNWELKRSAYLFLAAFFFPPFAFFAI
jgi:hypothetical protein